MKLKELRSAMQEIAPFAEPKIELEQFPTGAELASRFLFTVDNMHNEFSSRTVVDLGCGTGMLAIGAALLGSSHVLAIDCDGDALATAAENCGGFEDLPVDLLQCDISSVRQLADGHLSADTVIMNPPFGTRQKGADMEFLRAAFAVSRGAVYSLHKSSTREHVKRVATGELHATEAEVVAQLRYDLPASYAYHRLKSKDIQVDLWRFTVPSCRRNE